MALRQNQFMRSILNISLPEQMAKMVKKEVRKGKYASTSEFFRLLLRDYEEESKILSELEEIDREFESGKGKVLRSLKGLR